MLTSLGLGFPLIDNFHSHIVDPHKPSGVRVFAKSVHLLAAGWLVSVGWLWVAGLRQHLVRQGVFPDDFGMSTVLAGALSAVALEFAAVGLVRWTGRAPWRWLERREWHHAFWWSAIPNLLLLATVYLMIVAAF